MISTEQLIERKGEALNEWHDQDGGSTSVSVLFHDCVQNQWD